MRAMLKFLALFRGIITEREGLLIYSLVFRFFCFGAFNFNLAAPKTATMFVCVCGSPIQPHSSTVGLDVF